MKIAALNMTTILNLGNRRILGITKNLSKFRMNKYYIVFLFYGPKGHEGSRPARQFFNQVIYSQQIEFPLV